MATLSEDVTDANFIDWTTELTWTLVTAIEDDEEIRDGLFPGVGAIKRKGGKPKTHYYYILAVTCFATHDKYQDAFAMDPESTEAQLAAHRKLWSGKIKNRIAGLVTKARENITEMGETGAGVDTEEEITPGTSLTTKWDQIKGESPWFFKMRALIASRPNLQPVGIGNNDSNYDVSILIPTYDDADTASSAPDDTQDLPIQLVDPKSEPESDSDDEIPPKRKRVASKGPEDQKPTKKTKPQPATSAPAVPATTAPAKKAVVMSARDRFSATVLAEEETAQAVLGLKKDKNSARKEVMIAKIKMEGEIRVAKERARAEEKAGKRELARLKMEQDHQLRMAQLQGSSSRTFPSGASSSSSHRSSPFYYDSELPPITTLDAGTGSDGSSYTGLPSS
ncbi:hypothetical protein K438DRAFT_2023231 [Mycena galopus ATCC 62051]|nr:hypothetical protein K438DRAFT_2023231 [Mycena galopus ATCC 62051]